MSLVFNSTTEGTICIILQRTSTDNTKPKVTESEIIGTNHLEFAKSLFQQYSQQLNLNNNHYPAESAFNFYVNERITNFLGRPVDIESARENFYSELIQHTNLPRNHSFAPIIREINQEIKRYTQKTFPITCQNKDKEKLQTPAVTPKGIQIPNWKKQRIESLIYPSYYYMPGSTINIASADASTSTKTPLARIAFQSKQKKNELLGAYGNCFKRFKSRLPTPLGFRSPPYQPDFRTVSLWKITESKEKENEDQEFNYQNQILENLNIQTQQHLENSEIETLNIQTSSNQRNQNPELINQQNLPLVIVINQLPINPIAEPIQQPLQLPPQQPMQQQLLQQPPQPLNLNPMAYTPITKLDNFTSKENDTQVWLNDIEKAITANGWNDAKAMQAIFYFLKDTANLWYQSLVNKPQDFNTFKVEFLKYFSNNNSINRLVNTFITMKQGETEAVITYLGRFHRNLHQIQAIDTNYFTVLQILNQFIHDLRSSILQHVRPLHLGTLQDAVTHARDFESAKSEANHTQAVNLVINRSSELDSKLENLHNDIIIKETLIGPKINHVYLHRPINSGHRKRISATIVVNKDISKLTKSILKPRSLVPNSESISKSKSIHLPTNDAVINLSVSSILSPNLLTTATSDLLTTTATNNLSTPTNPNTTPKLTIQQNPKTENNSTELKISDSSPSTNSQFFTATIWITPNPNFQNYLSLLVTPEDATPNDQELGQPPTSNILPATITENKSLDAIFPFKLEEPSITLLFSGAALEEKPITTMYTDVKIDGHFIKLIFDSGSAIDQAASARIITADGTTKTSISKIDDLPIKINGIIIPIKIFVMEATQYQALVDNDWLSKTNTTLD
ncbi:hypothetical protein G9A89_022319 [Geosiphon pyriformis]|nr:hypothetical protein G9A89_022319 [Geosiphon pyriformis]